MDSNGFACIENAWEKHQSELRGYFTHRLGNVAQAEDLLQEVFLKAVRQEQQFFSLENPRAWLYQVAHNALVDYLRLKKSSVPLPDDLIVEPEPVIPVDDLSECVVRVLSELSDQDRDIIQHCDIEGTKLQVFADSHHLTLPAVKSRIQRARQRMRSHMTAACQVKFDEVGHVCCHVPRLPQSPQTL
ncbi:MAG: sigma-70 family RNA polymerase sigma factor [Burkholderiales bacterium]|nr:sigma-70 family RNA polymerase sigma factor [Ferrovum sp.]